MDTFYTYPFSNYTESDETKPSSCELKFFFKIPMITTLSVLTLSELIQAIRLGWAGNLDFWNILKEKKMNIVH